MRSGSLNILLAATAAVLVAAGEARPAYVYSESLRVIRACNLLLPGVDPNSDPSQGPVSPGYRSRQWNAGLFGVLEQRLDLKPPGWTFVNPLAPAVVTPEIAARYSDTPLPLTVGQVVTKDMPCYWDVRLGEVTLSRLLQFDVVYLHIPAGVKAELTPDDRELLRKLVDSGAQLWIDWGGGAANPFTAGQCGTGFFLDDVNFQPQPRQPANVVHRHHALLSYPYWLSQPEINALGANVSGGVASDGNNRPPFPAVFAPVVLNGGGLPQIAAGRYGSGHIILTANNIGANIVRAAFGSRPDLASPGDLKFAYNVVAWASNYTTTYANAARSSSSSQGPGAPLVKRWSFPVGGAPGASAVIYKGVVFHSGADGKVYALDGVPQQDLDNDGSPDDGVPDFSDGAPFDVLWSASADGAISGPSVFSWPGGEPFPAGVDVVMVMNAGGRVLAAPAFPRPLGGQRGFHEIMSVPGWGGTQVPSPTYHNGIVYAVGGNGYLYCRDLGTREQWNIPGNMTTPYGIVPRPASPTVGWVQDVGTKALDLMAYWLAGTTGVTVQPSDRIFSAIFSVRNEPLARLGGNIVATRYNNSRTVTDSPYRLWAVLGSGACQDLTTAVGTPTAKGQFVLSNPPSGVNAATPVYADYQLSRNMALATTGQDLSPRSIYAPKPDPQAGSNVQAWNTSGSPTVAMGPDGTLYAVGSRNNGSQLTAVQEFGPRFNLLQNRPTVPQHIADWHFWFRSVLNTADPLMADRFYPAYDYTLDSSSSGTGVPLDDFEVIGPPAVTADGVYVTAIGRDASRVPAVALFAFARKWDFRVDLPPGVEYRDQQGNLLPVRIWQPNPFTELGTVRSPREEAAIVRDYAIDRARGTITISNFDDANFLMGPEKRPLFAGIPVRVWVGDVEVPVQMDRFSNLRWYFVAYRPDTLPPGAGIYTPANRAAGRPSPASVLGEYVYFTTAEGMIYAVRAAATPDRGKQVFGVKPNYMTETEWRGSSRDVVWQELIDGGVPLTNPIAGANGLLAVSGETGLYVFDSPGTIIADSNRILEVDAGAGAVWSVSASTRLSLHGRDSATATGMSVKKTPFSRPSVVRMVDSNDLVVCDTGNNRIVRVDRAGQVVWEITSFVDPLRLLPSGEPLKLASPTDVRVWSGIEMDPLLRIPALVYHYLIADRDNFRVLDLIVRFDVNGRPLPVSNRPEDAIAPGQEPPTVLNWVSATRSEGRLLRFETAQLFPRSGPAGTMDVWAAVSNYSVEDPAAAVRVEDARGGAVVRLDYGDVTVGADGVADGVANWTYRPGRISWATNLFTDGGVTRRMANPRYFERYWTAGGVNSILCDGAGVWELTQSRPDGPFVAVWRLTTEAYQNELPRRTSEGAVITGTGVPLRATSARVLPGGRILISNSYSGIGAGGNEFRGEVFEVDNRDGSGNPIPGPTGIYWSAPAVVSYEIAPGVQGLRQEIRGSYLVEQPTFVDRR